MFPILNIFREMLGYFGVPMDQVNVLLVDLNGRVVFIPGPHFENDLYINI